MNPTPKDLKRLSRTIVSLVHPKRLILFGSAARGKMGTHSDLDLLVVMPDGAHRRHTTDEIYRGLWGFGWAADIIVVTERDVAEYGSNPYMIIHSALAEGLELYRAA
jgi:predicted nucleotidyltransferase